MNRRDFLARLGFGTVSAAAAALTFDVEKLLWVPGEKTIVLPPLLYGCNNTFITPTWVTREVAREFKNSLRLIQRFDRSYDDRFSNVGTAVPLTIARIEGLHV
jgi:hypothetical protein